MKNFLLIFLLFLFSVPAYSQAPQLINYQGVARNSVGNVLPNKEIKVKLSIHEGNATGTIVYSETRSIKTNSFGLFFIAIGSEGASNVIGTVAGINWQSGAKYLQVEIDPAGGSDFLDLGTAQLLSVPYALHAGSSGPTGNAGGVLTGTYPNPGIANGVITQSMLAPGVIPSNLPPTGAAGGDLAGTYPNPIVANGTINTIKLADNSITTSKIIDASVTAVKLAPGVIPTSLPPNGAASGDLTGTYPNPIIANGVVNTNKLADGSVTAIKLAPGVIPSTLPPSGNAGGDLIGIYPNPIVADGVITNSKLADNTVTTGKLLDAAVTTSKLADGSVTSVKLAPGIIPTSLPPNGVAGGSLTGNYPNPTIANGAITQSMLGPGVVMPPGGPAGGDLSGIYPNPTVATGAINTIKLADNSITTSKIVDASVTSVKLAPGVIPTTLPPNGTAGGDLTGTYPNPIVGNGTINTTKLADNSITTSKIVDASVTAVKLAPGIIPTTLPPNGSAGGDLSGLYPNPTVASGAITNSKLADNAVTTGKLLDAAVTTPKLADGSVTSAKLAPGVIPTSLPPNGAAGGSLTGSYPNPTIANGAITQSMLGPGVVMPPGGPAGGDLTGVYPDPVVASGAINTIKLADNSITTSKIVDASVTTVKLAPGVIPTTLPPSGTAGGDLTGTYPNPVIGTGVITTNKIADNAITTAKVLDASITLAKLGPDVVLSGGNPTGPAGGDLSGTYPDPNIKAQSVTTPKIANGAVITPKLADGAVTTNKIADNSITTVKVVDGSITLAKLGPDVVFGGGNPTGPAGGDLSGTYPNPDITAGAITTTKLADNSVTTSKIIDASVTTAKLAAGVIPTSLPPNGIAGGDLTGTFPNPTVANGMITSSKLADNSVITSKIMDASVTTAKLAAGVIPATLPPSGAAGGDLSGTYPTPLVSKIQNVAVNNTAPTNGQVLKFNGTAWAPGTDDAGTALTLPYAATNNNVTNLFSLTNQGSGSALEGINSSVSSNAFGVIGRISASSPGSSATAVRGINSGTGVEGIGVWGSHNGFGKGVYGTSASGNAVQGNSIDGTGIFGTSTNGAAGYFDISNASNFSDALVGFHIGSGSGVTGISENGNGLWGITNSPFAAGVIGTNGAGGEAVVGQNFSSVAAAVAGKNYGTFAGIQGVSGADDGIAIHALANQGGLVNGTAIVSELEQGGSGNHVVYKTSNSNVARIDHTGKGFFNGGTQVGGADVAEYFDVEGNIMNYEPGDVLIISQSSDRRVEKSVAPYSTLVAGVYATKPGIMLTERNAEQDQLDNMVPMGVIGVIPTKVCVEGGPIRRGDLIVTSSLTGVAMKADIDRVKPGQIIGKALQDYNENGIGKINVLVSIK